MKKRISLWTYLLIPVALLLFTASIWAADFPEISTSDLKNKLDSNEGVFLLNAESDIDFNVEHIPGAVNIPSGALGEITPDKLPRDKDKLIVVY